MLTSNWPNWAGVGGGGEVCGQSAQKAAYLMIPGLYRVLKKVLLATAQSILTFSIPLFHPVPTAFPWSFQDNCFLNRYGISSNVSRPLFADNFCIEF